MQNVVDAAAIAGAKALPCRIGQAEEAVKFYIPSEAGKDAIQNYIANAKINTELSDNGKDFGSTGSKYCRVTLTAPAKSMFMQKLLHWSPNITVRAVAIRENTGYAIFANDGKVTGLNQSLRLSCNNVEIHGNIHSNNGILTQVNNTILDGNVTAWNYSDNITTSVPNKIPFPDLSAKRTQAEKDGTLVIVSYGDSITKTGTANKPMFYEDAGTDSRGMSIALNASGPYYATFYSQNYNIDFSGNALTLYGSVVAESINFHLTGNLSIHAPSDASSVLIRLIR